MYSKEKDFVSNYKEFKKSKIKHHDNVSTGEILTYRKKYYELTKKENRKLMDKIDKIGNANSPKAQKMQNEMKCNDFKSKMLENGWSPVDLPVLDEMYQTAQKLTNPQHKDSAKAYIDAMMNSVVANKEAKQTRRQNILW